MIWCSARARRTKAATTGERTRGSWAVSKVTCISKHVPVYPAVGLYPIVPHKAGQVRHTIRRYPEPRCYERCRRTPSQAALRLFDLVMDRARRQGTSSSRSHKIKSGSTYRDTMSGTCTFTRVKKNGSTYRHTISGTCTYTDSCVFQ